MSALFWSLAAAMIAAALALVLVPLLRGGADPRARKLTALDAALAAGVLDAAEHARKRAELVAQPVPPESAPRALVLALALVMPLAAIVLYRFVGEPRAFDPALMAAKPADAGKEAPDMAQAVAGLAARLEQNPDDVDGWLLLARAYKQMQRLDDAKAAFDRVRDRLPNDPDVMVEYAETLALTSPERAIAGESRTLLEKAAEANPQHQRALWLLGISDAQAGNYSGAIANWERLLPLLPADSDVAKSVGEQIADARREAGLPASAKATSLAPAEATASTPASQLAQAASAPAAAPGAGPALTVKVELSPELQARLAPTDVLFVFARLPQGPRMPLAIQRLPAASLPLTVTLDDSMGMLPTLKLSTAEQVVVGARVSKSGNAAPQSGDFEALSAPITVKTQIAPIALVIRDVVP